MIVLLDDAAISFCHYEVKAKPHIISEDVLRKGIVFAMKHNLTIQFVYPAHELPQYVHVLVETIDHVKIGRDNKTTDIVVCEGWPLSFEEDGIYVMRINKDELMSQPLLLQLPKRLIIALTDIETFTDSDFAKYKAWLEANITKLQDSKCQVNILTDRIVLDSMNNCNAGFESITLAPNGKFYICPGFFEDGLDAVGDLDNGLNINNKQLYSIDYAPICRTCDAYHCRRCVWLNRKTTMEVNTPSRQQCVIAHLERNASRIIAPERIKQIDYLDPFDKFEK